MTQGQRISESVMSKLQTKHQVLKERSNLTKCEEIVKGGWKFVFHFEEEKDDNADDLMSSIANDCTGAAALIITLNCLYRARYTHVLNAAPHVVWLFALFCVFSLFWHNYI